MKTIAAVLLAAGALLSGAAPGIAGPLGRTEHFETLAGVIDGTIAEIPDPPVELADRSALKAWTRAGLAVEKALLKDTAKDYAKAGAKIHKTLSKAFPGDEGVEILLAGLIENLLQNAQADLFDLQASIDDLPDEDDVAFLSDLIDDAQAILDLADGEEDPAVLHQVCGKATKALGRIAKKYNKFLLGAAGPRGLSAVVDAAPFTAAFVEGTIFLDPATGDVKQVALEGFTFAGLESEAILIGITFAGDEGVVVPGTYFVDGLGIEGGYIRTGSEGPEEIINGEAGFITIASINPGNGSVSGIFEFSGPNLGETTGFVTSGQFNATNLIVQDLE